MPSLTLRAGAQPRGDGVAAREGVDAGGEEDFKEWSLAKRAVEVEIEGRAAELGTEALKRLDSGDPLAMQVWRTWLTTSTQNQPMTRRGGGAGRGGGDSTASGGGSGSSAGGGGMPHPLLAMLKGLSSL